MSDSKKWHQRWYVWLIILAVLGSVYSNKDNEDESQVEGQEENQVEGQEENQVEKERKEAIEIRSSTLYEAYDNNEISADNEYKDKWLKLTGKIIDISINPVKKSETIVKLNGLIDNEYEIIGVPCYFDESQNSEISSLTKGQTVTIIGKCLGKPLYIKIADCSIEQSVTRKASDNKTSNSTSGEAESKIIEVENTNGLPQEYLGNYHGVQPGYNMKNQYGDDVIINGQAIKVPASDYKFLVKEGNVISLQQTSLGDNSRYYYEGSYSINGENDTEYTIECKVSDSKGTSNPSFTIVIQKNTKSGKCTSEDQPDFDLEKIK